MPSKSPKYTYAELKSIIPFANLESIKTITVSIKEEHKHFSATQMTDILLLISRRLIALSNELIQ